MTNRFLLLSLLIYSLILAGLATLNSSLLILAVPLLIYLGAGLLYRPEALQFIAGRQLSAEYISSDKPVEVTLTLTNGGATTLKEVYIEDLVPPFLTLLEGETNVLMTLQSNESVTLNYTLSGVRGSYDFPGIRVTANDRFALFRQQTTLPVASQLLVLPQIIKLRRVEIRPSQTRVYAGTIPTRQGGPGVEFFGVREYQPGDPLRWINSRATARHLQSIFINEFQQERMADVGLILDARQQSDVSSSQGSLFEYAVQATAALANEFLNAGNRVGLFIYGNTLDWTYPGYGKVQRQRILWALARARPSASQVFAKLEHLPAKLFPARSQLVFLSPLLQGDAEVLLKLRARGYHLLVVSPNPIIFEGKGLGDGQDILLATRIAQLERDLLLNKLRQAGIRAMDWPVEMPFQEAAHAALRRFRPL